MKYHGIPLLLPFPASLFLSGSFIKKYYLENLKNFKCSNSEYLMVLDINVSDDLHSVCAIRKKLLAFTGVGKSDSRS